MLKETSLPNFEFIPALVGSELAGKGSARGTFQNFLPGFYPGFTAGNSAWPNFGELLPIL